MILDDTHSSTTLVDFNPYTPSTDPLLFTYPELHKILLQALEPVPTTGTTAFSSQASTQTTDTHTITEDGGQRGRERLPVLRVIDSQSHPEANRGMPAFGTNMMPVEMVEMSQGMGVGEFRAAWDEVVRDGILDQGDSSDSDDSEP